MNLLSPVFGNGETIPKKYTCDGKNVSPELRLMDVPNETKSFALVVEDLDSPNGVFTHWFVWNIESHAYVFSEGGVPERGIEAMNSFGYKKYGGPCPSPGAPHRYFFKVYALDTAFNFPEDEPMEHVLTLIEQHAIAEAELVGIYGRE